MINIFIWILLSGWNLCFNSEGLEKLNGVSGKKYILFNNMLIIAVKPSFSMQFYVNLEVE